MILRLGALVVSAAIVGLVCHAWIPLLWTLGTGGLVLCLNRKHPAPSWRVLTANAMIGAISIAAWLWFKR
jgi:hypothetical protein